MLASSRVLHILLLVLRICAVPAISIVFCLFRGPAYSSGCFRCVDHRHSRRTHIRIIAGAQALSDDAEAVAVDIGEAKLVP